MLIVGIVMLHPFLISVDAIHKIINRKDILEMSYGVVMCLSAPLISYLCIDVSLRGISFFALGSLL